MKVRNSAPYSLAAIAVMGVIMLTAFTGCEKAVTISPEVQAVLTYTFGESREPLSVVEDMVRNSYGNQEERLNLEKQFAAVLKMDDVTYEAKDFACRQLMLIGTDESIPAIATLLGDEKLSNMARYALEQNQSPEVDKVLVKALDSTSGLPLVGIINTLGNRGNAAPLAALEKLTMNSDVMVANAATAAVAKIRGTM